MPGRELLQVPGPTNIPDPVLRAISRRTIDHRGDEFRSLTERVLTRLPRVFAATDPVVIFPASATGAWEAALVNTLSPGDKVLAFDIGHFAGLWADLARRLGLQVRLLPGDWRTGVDPELLGATLREDADAQIKALLIVHNETSTGVTSDMAALREVIDAVGHPALLLVDAVSSSGAIEYLHDDWGADVTIAGSQKGLLMPPGVGFNVVSARARAAADNAGMRRAYWDWAPILAANRENVFPYTPPTNLLFGLDAALELLLDEGLDAIHARHARFARAVRTAVETLGLELVASNAEQRSDSVTACFLPEGLSETALHHALADQLGVVVGRGLGRHSGSTMRIGHLGDMSAAMLLGAIAALETALRACGYRPPSSGAAAAIALLAEDLSGTPGAEVAAADGWGTSATSRHEVLSR